LRDHVVVEGEARDNLQVSNIIQTITAYLESVRVGQARSIRGRQTGGLAGALGALGAGAPGEGVPGAPTPGGVPPGIPGQPGQVAPGVEGAPPGAVSPEVSPPVEI